MNLAESYEVGQNFWKVNPHMSGFGPFKDLYKNDKSKGKEKSSQIAWGVCLYCHSKEYDHLPEAEKKRVISNSYSVNFNSEKHLHCIDYYKEHHVHPLEKALQDMKQALIIRTNYINEFIKSEEYNLDTMDKVDNALSKNKKIWDDYFRIEEEYKKAQLDGTIRGNKVLSPNEKNQLQGYAE